MSLSKLDIYFKAIPKFENLNKFYTGEELFNYYKKETKILEIEPINNIRFIRKFRDFFKSKEEFEYLSEIQKKFNDFSQKLFDLKFKALEKKNK